MDYEEQIKALQARCDRLERGIMTLAVWLTDYVPFENRDLCELDEIIKGD